MCLWEADDGWKEEQKDNYNVGNYQRTRDCTPHPKREYVTGSNLAHDSVACHSISPTSGLRNKEEKIYNNPQKEKQIAAIWKKTAPYVAVRRGADQQYSTITAPTSVARVNQWLYSDSE